MQKNIKLLTKEFENFLVSSYNSLNNRNNPQLFSFIYQINEFEISNIIDSNLIQDKVLFYWKILEEGEEFLGIDPIFTISKNGNQRLSETIKMLNKLEKNIYSNWDPKNFANFPLFMGGIKFAPNQSSERWDDYNDSDWFVPRILLLKNCNGYFVIYNFLSEQKSEIDQLNNFTTSFNFLENLLNEIPTNKKPKHFLIPINFNSVDKWKIKVENALDKINKGTFDKVVISREVEYELSEKPNVSRIVNELSLKYPKCYTFAYKKGDSVFIGASPEKLAKFSNGWLEVDALAGSAPRGSDEKEDNIFEQFLLNSDKNLKEQQSVVNFITGLIKNISDEIYFDEKPIIRKLPNIQHLWTLIRAKLKSDYRIFDVLLKLHPTPAICGTPWDVAQKYILEVEEHDRGLYSGNVGWFNFTGTGEFAVAIRSALIKNDKLFAYSGCGIVEGSEPKSEFEESEIKLKPILSLFADEKIYQS